MAAFCDVPSGRLLFVHELAAPRLPAAVRLLVRVESFDAVSNVAQVVDACFAGQRAAVDLTLAEPVAARLGGVYVVIADVADDGQASPRLKARIVADASGIDTDLYVKALRARRKFLGEEALVPEPVAGVAAPAATRAVRPDVVSLLDEDDEDL